MTTLFPPGNVKIRTIAELTREIKTLVEDAFPSVWAEGEVVNCKKHGPSGHWYLALRDPEAQIDAVIWRGVALRLKFDVKDGMKVIVRGRLDVYPPHGKYKLIVEELSPKGIGAKELALRQLKEKLFTRGYFDPNRKRPLPRYPMRIALVTSPSGAAVRDMLKILGRRWPAAEVWICPVQVQGDGAAESIAAAIGLVNRVGEAMPVDVLIVGRGGGSVEDLWAFNAECLADAIFESRIPIVSAVGHEIDITLADLVADFRAATPSEAAEHTAPDRSGEVDGLLELEARLRALLRQRLAHARRCLDDLSGRRVFRLPLGRLRDLEQRLDDRSERMSRALRHQLNRAKEQVDARAGRLGTLSPLNVLARGYSLTLTEMGQTVMRDPGQVLPGERIVTLVQRGRIVSRVEETVVEPPGGEL